MRARSAVRPQGADLRPGFSKLSTGHPAPLASRPGLLSVLTPPHTPVGAPGSSASTEMPPIRAHQQVPRSRGCWGPWAGPPPHREEPRSSAGSECWRRQVVRKVRLQREAWGAPDLGSGPPVTSPHTHALPSAPSWLLLPGDHHSKGPIKDPSLSCRRSPHSEGVTGLVLTC